jgi:hypothetical protein
MRDVPQLGVIDAEVCPFATLLTVHKTRSRQHL